MQVKSSERESMGCSMTFVYDATNEIVRVGDIVEAANSTAVVEKVIQPGSKDSCDWYEPGTWVTDRPGR